MTDWLSNPDLIPPMTEAELADELSPVEWLQVEAEDAREYLGRMDAAKPSLMLRRVADQFPEFEWLAWLPPEERHWYLSVGDAEYIRQAFFPHLPDWAYEALTA